MMGSAIDLTGRRFDRLEAIEPTEERDGTSVVWRCVCDCGNECLVSTRNLMSGNTKSCGCLRREAPSSRKTLTVGTDLSLLTRKRSSNNTSGVRGVSFDRTKGKYKAYIKLAGKQRTLGNFDTLEEAAQARREAEVELYDPILEAHGRRPTGEGR